MPGRRRLSDVDFLELAAGEGGPTALGVLRAGQVGKRLLLLAALVETSGPRVEPAVRASLLDAFAVLAAARRVDRDAADRVLLHPVVGIWLRTGLRGVRGASARGETVPDRLALGALGALGGLAVAASLRAGCPFDLAVRPVGGAVMLPTIGLLRVQGADELRLAGRGDGSVAVRSRGIVTGAASDVVAVLGPADGSGGRVPVAAGDGDGLVPVPGGNGPVPVAGAGVEWTPTRALRSPGRLGAGGLPALGLEVLVEDVDPARDGFAQPVADRLTEDEIARWRACFDAGWRLLVDDHPHRAARIRSLVSTLVPMRRPAASSGISASSADAFGAVALTLPTDRLAMAATLVHEFQHMKLSALLDLAPMIRPGGPAASAVLYAPWRPDPRPAAGLLQGVYAHVGLCAFWWERYRRGGPDAGFCAFEFVRCRDGAWRALGTLRTSGALTELGEHFTAGLVARVRRWRGCVVPAQIAEAARAWAGDHVTTWRLRNLVPDAAAVRELADAYLARRPPPAAGRPATTVSPGPVEAWSDARLQLLWLLIGDTAVSDAIAGSGGSVVSGASLADVLLTRGDHDAAGRLYREALLGAAGGRGRLGDWSGLARARRRDAPSGWALRTCPESVRALGIEVTGRTGAVPDPDSLAGWLGSRPARRGLSCGRPPWPAGSPS